MVRQGSQPIPLQGPLPQVPQTWPPGVFTQIAYQHANTIPDHALICNRPDALVGPQVWAGTRTAPRLQGAATENELCTQMPKICHYPSVRGEPRGPLGLEPWKPEEAHSDHQAEHKQAPSMVHLHTAISPSCPPPGCLNRGTGTKKEKFHTSPYLLIPRLNDSPPPWPPGSLSFAVLLAAPLQYIQ